VPEDGIGLWVLPDRLFGRLGGEGLAARDWIPAKSASWEEQPDGSFAATAMLYPGKLVSVRLEGPGAAVVTKVRCIDGDRRGISCEGDAALGWSCACRSSSRIGVYSDRWSIPWVAARSRFDEPVEVPRAVTACLRFPDVPAEERRVVVIAPRFTPLESAKEADSEAVAAGAEICVRVPVGARMTVGLGGIFSPAWSGRDGAPPGTRTWTVAPTRDGSVDLPIDGGWADWPVPAPGGSFPQ
jgi:hypothetical protein